MAWLTALVKRFSLRKQLWNLWKAETKEGEATEFCIGEFATYRIMLSVHFTGRTVVDWSRCFPTEATGDFTSHHGFRFSGFFFFFRWWLNDPPYAEDATCCWFVSERRWKKEWWSNTDQGCIFHTRNKVDPPKLSANLPLSPRWSQIKLDVKALKVQ